MFTLNVEITIAQNTYPYVKFGFLTHFVLMSIFTLGTLSIKIQKSTNI